MVLRRFKVSKEAIKFLMKKIIPKNNILCEPQVGKEAYIQIYLVKIRKQKL